MTNLFQRMRTEALLLSKGFGSLPELLCPCTPTDVDDAYQSTGVRFPHYNSSFIMNEQAFVDKRETDWQRLSQLCDDADNGLKRMSGQQILEMIRLYRRVSTDLATARTKSTNVALITYLNDLAGRTYGVLYRSPNKPFFQVIQGSIALSAQTFRRNRWFVLLSAVIFFGSAFFIGGLLTVRPDVKEVVIPAQMEPLFDHWKKGTFEDRGISGSGMMTGFYASNNPRTSIITGSIGAGSFGLFSIYLLFENGEILGALGYEMQTVGKLPFLVSSIAPHGVPELSGIIVSGSCGLLLGYAVLNPGRRRRADALRAVGRDAIVLLATSVVLMFIAAPIEGFFSFQPGVPQWLKAAVAVLEVIGWAMFWSSYGRQEKPDPHPLTNR